MFTLPRFNPRAFLGSDAVSPSELSGYHGVIGCQAKWDFHYVQKLDEETGSPAMERGTQFHKAAQDWWLTGNYIAPTDPTVAWVMGRYAEFHEDRRKSGECRVLVAELPFAVQLPDGPYLFGYLDGIMMVDGVPWVWDIKTMGDWTGLLSTTHSMQMDLYGWASTQLEWSFDFSGYEKPVGVLIDAVRMFQPKKTELILPESFQSRFMPHDRERYRQTLAEVDTALMSMEAIRQGSAPTRNTGMGCRGCPYIGPCYNIQTPEQGQRNKGAVKW